jgi:hypothetical protein
MPETLTQKSWEITICLPGPPTSQSGGLLWPGFAVQIRWNGFEEPLHEPDNETPHGHF